MKLINRITPLLLAVEITHSSPLACPYATSGSLIYFDIRLELDIGNASCSAEQQAEMYANFQSVLKFDNGTIADQSLALLTGQLCGTYTNSTNRHRVLTTLVYWSGRICEFDSSSAACWQCTVVSCTIRHATDHSLSYVLH